MKQWLFGECGWCAVFVCLSVWVGAPAAPKVTLLDGSTNLEAHNLSPPQGLPRSTWQSTCTANFIFRDDHNLAEYYTESQHGRKSCVVPCMLVVAEVNKWRVTNRKKNDPPRVRAFGGREGGSPRLREWYSKAVSMPPTLPPPSLTHPM